MKFNMEVDAERMISQLQMLGQERINNNTAVESAGLSGKETVTCIAMPGTRGDELDQEWREEKFKLEISAMTESVEEEGSLGGKEEVKAVNTRPNFEFKIDH